MKTALRRLAVFCLLSAASLGSGLARAQDPSPAQAPRRDPAAAEALFAEGKRLMEAKRVAEACPKFEESYRLDPGVGALLNLAACEEQRGRIASAWSHYREAVDFLRRENDVRRATFAEQRAAALAPRLPKVVISVTSPPPGLVLQRDGVRLSEASLGSELPVDPGEHELVVEAPGYLSRTAAFTAKEREVVQVTVDPLEPAPAAPPPSVAATSETAPDPTRPPREGEDPGETQRWIGFVTGGVGIASLVVGGVFVGLTAANKSQADEGCPTPTTCSAAGFADVEIAKDTAMVANVTLIAGAALAAAGVVLVLTAPSSGDASAAWLTPAVGPGGASLSAHGAF